ncbi:VC2046/SO_2500 family protein [Agarivorans aestuarii]|uniref:VC2046/SO_2500 family protein n=1 Tax=Agarivorans aestuarii TaxID=1563703 RepID=A0ABU7G6N7_9ALTE|nr:VC2046/SO_2500 family protein [Agarivorans aestuarii]MEE1674882.1 VC2046/SO_2500 family protein [Agarivorans aestuarii]
MLVEQIRQSSLCDELQLGDTLNQSTLHGEQARFHLLLSMLSQNVCDQAQFSMQKQNYEQVQQDLRDKFQLAQARALKALDDEFPVQANWSKHLQAGETSRIRLEQALGGYAACAEDSVDGLPHEVMNNVDLLSRVKHKVAKPDLQQEIDKEVKGSDIYNLLSDFDYSKPLSVKYFN